MKNVNKRKKKARSGTSDSVKDKRRKHRIKANLHYARLVLVAMILWFFGWVMYEISSFTYTVYKDYRAQYDAYLARRREREADWDPRFNSYRNILIIGVDKGLDEGTTAANTVVAVSLDKETGDIRFIALPRGTAISSPLVTKASRYFKDDEIFIAENQLVSPPVDEKTSEAVETKSPDVVKDDAASAPAPKNETATDESAESSKAESNKTETAKADTAAEQDKESAAKADEVNEAELAEKAVKSEREQKIAARRLVAESYLKEAHDNVSSPLCAAYATGGAKGLTVAAAEFLGITLHQYVVIDIDTAIQTLDLLGGVDLYVAEPMRYDDPEQNLTIKIDRGYRHFDGKGALDYLRYRGGELGDIGRVERQQRFLRAIYKKFLNPSSIIKWPAIIEHLRRHLVTDGEVWDVIDLLMPLYRARERTPQTILLPGAIRADGRANWQPDLKELDVRRIEFFPRVFGEHMVEGEDASSNQKQNPTQ